ncbi:hypothetical protein THAOC_26839 [Thalassiosira oceanica]|uniref:Uncharacterized protein n=1 Tax=Thalassiosira oceanica TaxID=159749 RepID=K0S473_THAOC|nr:hypothetical protein THAOC_26839 [Thalassiosira oceanica]|eukprot:EJK53672.1 hypothetical protein THAOC_26839 [Thalassiosira oceanica]
MLAEQADDMTVAMTARSRSASRMGAKCHDYLVYGGSVAHTMRLQPAGRGRGPPLLNWAWGALPTPTTPTSI